jgi:alpha-methylacyl-CoA racemase
LGPLDGIRVIEMAGMGPGPFAAMLLADLGADVIRVDRWSDSGDLPDTERRVRGTDPTRYVLHRGRRSLGVDLKAPGATELLLDMAAQADALIEGFRPGVMERLGLGPDVCLARNPRLIYGRMTGWGQDGPLAATAGHDINYIALSGALHQVARKGERPLPPVNLVGDMGGGGLILAYGVVCALLAVARGGGGQVVDAAITDGSALLTAMLYGLVAQGRWSTTPGTNFADTGAPYYEVYETADGKHVAVGAIEPRFYATLIGKLGLEPEAQATQNDQSRWPETKARFAEIFRTRTRDQWAAYFEYTDACVTPVLSMQEAPCHPHNRTRSSFVQVDGVVQPAPAPRFSASPTRIGGPPPTPGEDTVSVLRDYGFTPARIEMLRSQQAIGWPA